MRLPALLLGLALVTPPAPVWAGETRVTLAVAAGGGLLDLISTEYAISKGGRELHPWGQEKWSRAVLTGVRVGAITGLDALLRSHGHDRAANLVRWIWAGVCVLASSWNFWSAKN